MPHVHVNSVRPDRAAGTCNLSFKADGVLVQVIGLRFSDGATRSQAVSDAKDVLEKILEANPE